MTALGSQTPYQFIKGIMVPTHLIAGLAVTLSIVFSASLLAQETDNAPEMKRLQTMLSVINAELSSAPLAPEAKQANIYKQCLNPMVFLGI